jgi:hypothetical protein
VKDLVRAAPDVEFAWSEALRSPRLQFHIDFLSFKVKEKSSERANLPRKDPLRSHRKTALADTISFPRTEACTLARTVELHELRG